MTSLTVLNRLLLVFVLFFSLAAVGFAAGGIDLPTPSCLRSPENPCSVSITENTVWPTGSVIRVSSNVNVDGSAVTLTIEPGAVILFRPHTSLKATNGGRILANGSSASPIVFSTCKQASLFPPTTKEYLGGTTDYSDDTWDMDTSCTGAPASGDYDNAIWIDSSSAMAAADSFSHLDIRYATTGVRVARDFGGVRDSAFTGPLKGIWLEGVMPSFSGSIRANSFSNFLYAAGINSDTAVSFSGSITDNSFTNFSGSAALGLQGPFSGSLCNNSFDNFLGSSTGVSVVSFSGTLCGNSFSGFSASIALRNDGVFSGSLVGNLFGNVSNFAISSSGTFSGNVTNNTFSGIGSGAAIRNTGSFSGNVRRNLFSNVSTGLEGAFSGTVSHNAYYNVAIPGGTSGQHQGDQDSATGFTESPFAGDSTRPYLLNSSAAGGAKLVDAGAVSVDSFLASRTTSPTFLLDSGVADIGFHYAQPAPYVKAVSPNGGESVTGSQTVSFQVQSAFGTPSGLMVRLGFSPTTVGTGTQIVSQPLSSFSCSGIGLLTCLYSWNSVSAPNGAYYLVVTGTDSNGSSNDYSDSFFSVSNASTPNPDPGNPNPGNPGGGGGGGGGGVPAVCGNSFCESSSGERASNCPDDCRAVCGDKACTHAESFLSCSLDCTVACGNNLCDSGETATNCPKDCGYEEERLLDSVFLGTVQVSSADEGIEGYSLADAQDAFGLVSVKRSFAVQTVEVGGQVVKRTHVVLLVSNKSGIPLKDLVLIERIPSDLVSDLSSVQSDFPFEVLSEPHALRIVVPALTGFQSMEVDYSLNVALTESEAAFFAVPVAVSVLRSSDEDVARLQCAEDFDCEDNDRCSANRCVRGVCYSVSFPEGEVCDLGSVCQEGACTRVASPYISGSGFDGVLVVTVLLLALALAAIGFEYFKKEE